MITVFGGSGFIGSHIIKYLRENKVDYYTPTRDEDVNNRNLDDVIYCIGLTADFRRKPFDTVDAHVTKLSSVLKNSNFNSFTYLSSTRVYIHNVEAKEESNLIVNSNDPSDIFNASKITGEILALNCGKKNIKIARISNVYGLDLESENFLTSIIKDAIFSSSIVLETTLNSSKDYIKIDDVVKMLVELSQKKINGIFNVSSGKNITNKNILELLSENTGADYSIVENPKEIVIPIIPNDKILKELNYKLEGNFEKDIVEIINQFKHNLGKHGINK